MELILVSVTSTFTRVMLFGLKNPARQIGLSSFKDKDSEAANS